MLYDTMLYCTYYSTSFFLGIRRASARAGVLRILPRRGLDLPAPKVMDSKSNSSNIKTWFYITIIIIIIVILIITEARGQQTCHFRKRATSVPAEGLACGLVFARRCELFLRALQAQKWQVRRGCTFCAAWTCRVASPFAADRDNLYNTAKVKQHC